MHILRAPDELARLIAQNAPAGFMADIEPAEWLSDPRHFALVDGDDLGLFEAGVEWPGPLCAHVIFASRGKPALETARAMLAAAFAFGATKILGETPIVYPHALMFARKLGFQPYAEADGQIGRVTLSALANPNPFADSRVA